jgi:hypothetical protein
MTMTFATSIEDTRVFYRSVHSHPQSNSLGQRVPGPQGHSLCVVDTTAAPLEPTYRERSLSRTKQDLQQSNTKSLLAKIRKEPSRSYVLSRVFRAVA